MRLRPETRTVEVRSDGIHDQITVDGHPAIFRRGGSNNRGIYYYQRGPGDFRALKSTFVPLKTSIHGFQTAARVGGPRLLAIGHIAPRMDAFVEMEWIFPNEASIPLKPAGSVDEALLERILKREDLPRNLARMYLRLLEERVLPWDVDCLISESGKIRWIDTDYWRKAENLEEFFDTENMAFSQFQELLRFRRAPEVFDRFLLALTVETEQSQRLSATEKTMLLTKFREAQLGIQIDEGTNHLAAVVLGRAPTDHELTRFQKLFDGGDSQPAGQEADPWAPSELRSILHHAQHTHHALRAALELYRVSRAECLQWAQAATSSENPSEALIAARVLKYSVLDDLSISYLGLATVDVLEAGLKLEDLYLTGPRATSPQKPQFVDALMVAKFAKDAGSGLFKEYRLSDSSGQPIKRKDIIRNAYSVLSRTAGHDLFWRGRDLFENNLQRAFEAQFRHPDFRALPMKKQERVAKSVRARESAFEDEP